MWQIKFFQVFFESIDVDYHVYQLWIFVPFWRSQKKKVSFDQELIYKMSALFYDDFFAKLKVVKRKHWLILLFIGSQFTLSNLLCYTWSI